jgi:5-methylcytosine-specific restriction endonuclease McrA
MTSKARWALPQTRVTKRAYDRRRYLEKMSALATLKLEAGCLDCGYAEYPEALQFDHILPKNFEISRNLSLCLERLLDETERCVVRCANCHAVKTRQEAASLG